MEATELRIGNYIHDNENREDDTVFVVSRNECPKYTDWNSGDKYQLVAKCLGTTDDYYEIEPAGIPLTEDWLKEFGFERRIENDGNLICFKKGKYTIARWIDDKWQFWINTIDIDSSPQYVHQLQNITHALTGKELVK